MLQKIIAYSLLLALIPSQIFTTINLSATELNTLDELPYGSIETDIHRTSESSDFQEFDHASIDREQLLDSFSTFADTASKPINEEKYISFSMSDTLGDRTLLAEKIIFEKGITTIMPGTRQESFFQSLNQPSTNPLDFFMQTGAISLNAYLSSTREGKRMEKKVSGVKGKVQVSIPKDITIRTLSGEIIDPSQLVIEPLVNSKKTKAKAKYEKEMKNRGNMRKGRKMADPEGFEFGIPGKHLIFSVPVTITIDTPSMTDGNEVDLLIFHEGDTDFNTRGLSLDPTGTCDALGNTDKPGTTAVVKNGKITFYTCGASSFTMNPGGGTTGSNDLRAVIGDCAQAQIYYNNLTQIYTGNPPATGCTGSPSVWPTLRIGATTYGNSFTAWTSATTTGSTVGNTYTATSTMRATVGGLNYDLIIDWRHTAPDKFLTWSWRVIIPTGNTQNVRFYYGMDSFVAGADANDVGYLTSTGGQTIGVYDNVANVLSAFRYLSGTLWTAYQANGYNTVRTRIQNGVDFTNAIQNTAGDLGFGVNWNFGTTPATHSGTIEWRLLPFVPTNSVDLVPGIAQPEGPLTTDLLSQLPITITNAGNLTSSGLHTVLLSLPTTVNGPNTSFSDAGWSCGAQVGTGVTCTRTTTIAPVTGNEIFRIPVTPTLAASGTSVRFDVRISNSGDLNPANNTAFTINNVVGGAPPNDPGGVGSENLWLRAGNGTNCTVQGCAITSWTNFGGLGTVANAVTGVGTVTYDILNQINGNPTLYFNNAALFTNNTLSLPLRANSIFTVTRIGNGGGFSIGTQLNTLNARSWRTSNTIDSWRRYNNDIYFSGANLRSVNVPAITSTIRQTAGSSTGYTDGRQVQSNFSTTSFVLNNIGIGSNGTLGSTLSNVAEVIIYPTEITLVQQKQVESYLAIKYGITLDQTSPTNYLGSNGTVIWNASTAGVYNKNIAGIARDDTSTLNQIRSQSVTNTGDIIVSRPLIGTNRQSLIWGNDGGAITAFTGIDAGAGFQRIPREWQFQEKNGDIGIVNIAYPASRVPVGFTGTLMMLTDNDGVFATGAISYTGTLSGSNWIFSANISDMEYITFARIVAVDTTPPFIVSNTVASGTLAPSGSFPITITYADTGSAIVPASLEGRIYAWDATGSTWSLTDLAPSYLSISSATLTTGVFNLSNLPHGRYRFDFVISDAAGNTRVTSYTYFIDAIEWIISSPVYSIGNAPLSATTFGSGEITITVRTVGAGFDLTMLRTSDLTYATSIISAYSGSSGWGYDKDIGSGYSSTITPHGTLQNLVTIPKNINQNGQKNTFTYRVKYGVSPPANSSAGDYQALVRFGINLTY